MICKYVTYSSLIYIDLIILVYIVRWMTANYQPGDLSQQIPAPAVSYLSNLVCMS